MSLEVARQLAERGQLLALEDAELGPDRVQERRGVPLAEHEPVGERRARLVRIEAPAPRRRRRADRLDTQPRGDVLEGLEEPVGQRSHPARSGQGGRHRCKLVPLASFWLR